MDYYKKIDDLPVWNFWQVIEDNEFGYLLKLENYEEIPEYDIEQLAKVWDDLDYQYFKYFGIDEKYYDKLIQEKKILLLEIEAIIEKSTFAIVRLRQEKRFLKEMSEEGAKIKNLDMLVSVEKFMGFSLNPKEISVKKFYSYVKNMVKK